MSKSTLHSRFALGARGLALSALLVAPQVQASPLLGEVNDGHAALDFSFFTNSDFGRFTTMAPVLRAQIAPRPDFILSADFGLTYARVSALDESLSTARPGNPFFAAHYVASLSASTRLRVGAGVALPVATLPESTVQDRSLAASSYGGALASRGLQEAWLWTPESLAIVLPARLEGSAERLRLGADLALAALIPARHGNTNRETDVVLQLGGDLGFVAGPATLGARLQLAWLATVEDGDPAQVSAEPFVRLDLGPAFLVAAITLNLDEPLGFAFDDEGVWGGRFGAGATF